jgi:hypothetical protein
MKQSLQRKAAPGAGMADMPPVVHDVLRSPGEQLDPATRAYMEPRFGHDFSRVRVHHDDTAARSAREVSALAYTVGSSVVFGAGQYTPQTPDGQHLLAHELMHVIQQQRGQNEWLQRQAVDPEDTGAAEEEAERAAAEIATKDKRKSKGKKGKSSKATDPCTRTILAEGTCADLVAGSRYICCDPDNGIERKGKKTDIDGTPCPSEKFTPIFTCDNKCSTALEKGCSDNDNWMAIPHGQFSRKQCGDIWTICANGLQTTGYVRDRSVTKSSYEVSPAIQNALGVPVGSSFNGAVYGPNTKKEVIDKDPCCQKADKAVKKDDKSS